MKRVILPPLPPLREFLEAMFSLEHEMIMGKGKPTHYRGLRDLVQKAGDHAR
jgi:hypothetical protein